MKKAGPIVMLGAALAFTGFVQTAPANARSIAAMDQFFGEVLTN